MHLSFPPNEDSLGGQDVGHDAQHHEEDGHGHYDDIVTDTATETHFLIFHNKVNKKVTIIMIYKNVYSMNRMKNIVAQMVNPPSANVEPTSIIFNQEKEVLENRT